MTEHVKLVPSLRDGIVALYCMYSNNESQNNFAFETDSCYHQMAVDLNPKLSSLSLHEYKITFHPEQCSLILWGILISFLPIFFISQLRRVSIVRMKSDFQTRLCVFRENIFKIDKCHFHIQGLFN